MLTRNLCAPGFVLALCLAIAPRTMAKPPDLPQPAHPDLMPGEPPDIFFVPLLEPFAPLTITKVGEEEQETRKEPSAQCGCPFTCPLCGLLSGPFCSWLWKQVHDDPKPIEVRPGAEEASSERGNMTLEPTLVAMGHDLTDLMEGRDADELVRELVRLIETTIAPKSWANRGGSGRLDYNPELKTFFILQTEDVQEAIRELINLKRSENAVEKKTDEEPQEHSFPGTLLGMDILRPTSKAEHNLYISDLLENAHRNLLAGRVAQAQTQVREALARDRKAVLAHPLVYKMQLLHQVLDESVPADNEDRNSGEKPILTQKQLAAKDLKVADFYRRRGKDASAWMYYRLVQRRHPNTDEANQAAKRIAELTAKLQRQGKSLPHDPAEPEPLVPHMPGVDPGVIRAYHEILEMAPKKTPDSVCPVEARQQEPKKPAILEVQ